MVLNNVHGAIPTLTITLLIWCLMKHRDTLNIAVSWGKRAGSGSGTVIPEIVALVCGSGMSCVVKCVLSHVIFKDDHE
jgi:hypothetical protein